MPTVLLTLFARPWFKYVLGGIAAALIIIFVVHRWHGYQDSLRQEGRDQMAAQVQQTIRLNDANNRNLEQSLQTMLSQYGQRLDHSLAAMDAKQNQSTQTITRIIHERPQVFNNPACVTPPDVIEERNRIRAQGPE